MITDTETQTSPTEHRIPEALLGKKVRVTVVGCGGTGSTIAAGLPYVHQAMLAWGHPYGLDVTLVDGDRIRARTVFVNHSAKAKLVSKGDRAGDTNQFVLGTRMERCPRISR